MARKSQGLTPKQRQFVREYLVDLNATQAAIRAGYKAEWANKYASQLLGKTRLRRAVREAMEVRAARTEATADRVVRELALVAFSDIADYQHDEETGRLSLRPSAPFGAKRALSSVKRKHRSRTKDDVTEHEYELEIRLWDKVAALKTLCQHLGILKAPEMPPLESILAALPPDVAGQLRSALSRALPGK
jgi:phage terminase small subunit